MKGFTNTIKNETKEQKGGFLSMLLGTLGISLLGNVLTGKGIARAGYGNPLQNKMNFNTAWSFSKLWNTKILLELIKIQWSFLKR